MDVPIVLAPMAGVSTADLVAAVSNAGGLGMFGAGMMAAEVLREHVKSIKKKITRAGALYGVNLFVPSGFLVDDTTQWTKEQWAAVRIMRNEIQGAFNMLAKDPTVSKEQLINLQKDTPTGFDEVLDYYTQLFERQIDVVVEERVPVVSFHFGWPPATVVSRLRGASCFLMGCATNVPEALWLRDCGADAIIVQGSEAGGHQGTFMSNIQPSLKVGGSGPSEPTKRPLTEYKCSSRLVGLTALLPSIVSVTAARNEIPIIAAGGIMNGAGVVAALTLGAHAVQMGTAFLTTYESGAAEYHKAALLNKPNNGIHTPTVMSQAFTGKPARGIVNSWVDRLDDVSSSLPNCFNALPSARQLHKLASSVNRTDLVPLWAGQGYALCRPPCPAGKLVEELMTEANLTL